MTERPWLTCALALVALAACSDDKVAAKERPAEQLVAAWRKAGLEVSAMAAANPKPFAAETCQAGTVNGVDVVLCDYDSGEDATAAEDLGLGTLTGVTGAALAKGSRLLVVADRRKVDPSGRTIDAITRAFRR